MVQKLTKLHKSMSNLYQYNGKEWIEDSNKLKELMLNDEKVVITDERTRI